MKKPLEMTSQNIGRRAHECESSDRLDAKWKGKVFTKEVHAPSYPSLGKAVKNREKQTGRHQQAGLIGATPIVKRRRYSE